MCTLMEMASVGVDPFPDRPDFLATIKNKAIEYLSAGLPVLSSPKKGVLRNLLKDHGCRMSYADGDDQELTAVVLDLYRRPHRLLRMSEQTKASYLSTFTAERVYNNMAQYLEQVAVKFGHNQRGPGDGARDALAAAIERSFP